MCPSPRLYAQEINGTRESLDRITAGQQPNTTQYWAPILERTRPCGAASYIYNTDLPRVSRLSANIVRTLPGQPGQVWDIEPVDAYIGGGKATIAAGLRRLLETQARFGLAWPQGGATRCESSACLYDLKAPQALALGTGYPLSFGADDHVALIDAASFGLSGGDTHRLAHVIYDSARPSVTLVAWQEEPGLILYAKVDSTPQGPCGDTVAACTLDAFEGTIRSDALHDAQQVTGPNSSVGGRIVGFVNFALLDLPSVFITSFVVDNARIIVSRNSTGGEKALAAVSLIPLPAGAIAKVLGPVARLRPVVLTADGIRALGATLRSQLGRLGTVVRNARGGIVLRSAPRAEQQELGRVLQALETGCTPCFPAGTRVATPRGTRAIERLHVGERVWAENSKTGKVEAEPREAVRIEPVQPLVEVDLSDGSVVRATPTHAFWLDGGVGLHGQGWLVASKLLPGDLLRTVRGRHVHVVRLRRTAGHAVVYTLTVAKDHTFFVGTARVLVHNADGVCGVLSQVSYGSSDLGQEAILFRQQSNVFSARNVAVYEYRAADGSLRTIARLSERGVGHAERIAARDLAAMGIEPRSVTRIYSELEPCDAPGGYCKRFISQMFPRAEVTYSFEYGGTKASRQAGIDALRQALARLQGGR